MKFLLRCVMCVMCVCVLSVVGVILHQVWSVSHQGDEIGEDQLDLHLHLVSGVRRWTDVLVVAFEQVPNQLRLFITTHCTKQ